MSAYDNVLQRAVENAIDLVIISFPEFSEEEIIDLLVEKAKELRQDYEI